MVKLNQRLYKKHLTQLQAIKQAHTVKGEARFPYLIPLASWSLTPYT
jgi:hypothetical protein